jgi:hypothetical protein
VLAKGREFACVGGVLWGGEEEGCKDGRGDGDVETIRRVFHS